MLQSHLKQLNSYLMVALSIMIQLQSYVQHVPNHGTCQGKMKFSSIFPNNDSTQFYHDTGLTHIQKESNLSTLFRFLKLRKT